MSIQKRLYDLEQTPPVGTWDRIAAALDESHLSNEFPSKLYNAEALPPAAAWDKIASAIAPAATKVVPMRRGFTPILRYAAAAILIGLVALGVFNLTSNDSSSGVAETQNNPSISTKESTPEVAIVTPDAPAEVRQTTPDNSSNAIASTQGVNTTKARKARNYSSSSRIETAPVYASYESGSAIADRYVMLMTPNGIVRMSKKLGDMVCCVAGAEQDDDCKDQLKKLQEKMATSSMTHSTGNFMDILSLVSSLSDNDL
ncbi:MAG: hypothetical protein H7Y42_03610 [Chitinophagaceae bacterium]|nr:hypothetical protein [Chitinophagaceae bacterium]